VDSASEVRQHSRVRRYRWRRGFDKERWVSDVVDGPTDDDSVAELLRHVDDECSGTVKFYRPDKGWGGIESAQTPADVWVHFSNIEGEGFRSPEAGDRVVFRWEPTFQDSWRCIALWVRKVDTRSGSSSA
jgi:cold shock protein